MDDTVGPLPVGIERGGETSDCICSIQKNLCDEEAILAVGVVREKESVQKFARVTVLAAVAMKFFKRDAFGDVKVVGRFISFRKLGPRGGVFGCGVIELDEC